MNADGSGLRRVNQGCPGGGETSENFATWSPDGTRIALMRWCPSVDDPRGNPNPRPITVIDVATGAEREVGIVEANGQVGWGWSPDGKSIIEVPGPPGRRRQPIADRRRRRPARSPGPAGRRTIPAVLAADGPDTLIAGRALDPLDRAPGVPTRRRAGRRSGPGSSPRGLSAAAGRPPGIRRPAPTRSVARARPVRRSVPASARGSGSATSTDGASTSGGRRRR